LDDTEGVKVPEKEASCVREIKKNIEYPAVNDANIKAENEKNKAIQTTL